MDEIIEISICDLTPGYNGLCKPLMLIPPDATSIHHITEEAARMAAFFKGYKVIAIQPFSKMMDQLNKALQV